MTARRGLALTLLLAAAILVAAPSSVFAQPAAISACVAIPGPGSYVLTDNLSTSDPDCLVVAFPDVTIDLAGFQISCKGTCTGSGINAGGGAGPNLAVRNGTIRGFAVGIDLTKTDFARVEGVRLLGNTFGLDGGNGIIVKDCILADNAKGGLRVQLGGVITGNAITGTTDGTGIFAIRSVVTGNSVRLGSGGIGGGAGVMFGNAVSDAALHGIFTDESVIAYNFADSGEGRALGGSRVVAHGNNALSIGSGDGINVTGRSLVSGNRAEGTPAITMNCPGVLVENVTDGGISTAGLGCRRSLNIPFP
jgi:hypothetical protein